MTDQGGVVPGQRFGALTAVSASREPVGPKGHKRWVWSCLCQCGTVVSIPVGNLQTGNSKSCGCTKSAEIAKARTTHGRSRHRMRGRERSATPEYISWSSMIARCHNEQHPRFPEWGGRGVTVCAAWRSSFEQFLLDMGDRPDGTTLDRFPDRRGNYQPDNCRWATLKEQAQNKDATKISDSAVMTIRSSTRRLSDLASEYGVTADYIREIKKGRARANVY